MAPEPATLLWSLHWTVTGLPCGIGGSILIDAQEQSSMLLEPVDLSEPLSSGRWSSGPKQEGCCAPGEDAGLKRLCLISPVQGSRLLLSLQCTDMSDSFGFLLMV